MDGRVLTRGRLRFCKIIDGPLPSMKIDEADATLTFITSTRSAAGHCLVVPKRTRHSLRE